MKLKEQFWRYAGPPIALKAVCRMRAQLAWLDQAGFERVEVYWAHAGHAVFGGEQGSER